jgi:PAP2 superfamily
MGATSWWGRLQQAVHPADRTVLALLALALVVALVRWPAVGAALTPLVVVQSVLLIGFLACAIALARWECGSWVVYARPVATVAVVFTLYTFLGKLGVVAMPYLADAALACADRTLFGFDPSLALQPLQTPGRVEFFSFIYSTFILYINLSLFLGCLGRRPLERDQFLTGWVFTYVISYLGYIFLPAHGPVVYEAGRYTVALHGGFFYDTVVRGNELTGGLQGAFPSLHVGGSVYLCLFDLRTNRLRGLTYLPIVLLIYGATLFLRYHYVVDLIAGTAIAVACNPLGERVFLAWARDRQAAGRPALPGGEGDDLSVLSAPGSSGAALVFPSR